MGLVYQAVNEWEMIRSFPEETVEWSNALIDPGRGKTQVKAAAITEEEVDILAHKLDQMAQSRQDDVIAAMLGEEFLSIVLAVRMVKVNVNGAFMGILGAGNNLDIAWLRAKDIGGGRMNKDSTASCGLYAGTSGGVYTWLSTRTANTSGNLIPTQTMVEEAAVIHLGAIDPVEVPKTNMITFTLAGLIAPAQSLSFNKRRAFDDNQVPFVRFEKPIIVGPERKQLVQVMPNITGDDRLELVSLLICQAQDLTA